MAQKSDTTAQAAAGSSISNTKTINLALQGGGSHGAFGWGVMDKFLEDGRIDIEGICGTSAGSMNAAVFAYGKLKGNEGAREALHNFWKAISDCGQRFRLPKMPWDAVMQMENPFQIWMKAMTGLFSPYQLNPMNYNPLREILEQQVDFEELNKSPNVTKLFICATNVRTGKGRIFTAKEVNSDVILASACLPHVFQAVEIDGEHYWDGGYMGNPVLYPLFYYTKSRDVVILHINPIERRGIPKTAGDISNRLNEITFNSSLIKEMRAIYFVQKLLDDNWIKDEFRDKLKYVLIHSVRADNAMSDLNSASKMNTEWEFLTMLRDRGRALAGEWLAHNFQHLNVRSTVDLKKEFL